MARRLICSALLLVALGAGTANQKHEAICLSAYLMAERQQSAVLRVAVRTSEVIGRSVVAIKSLTSLD
jgi:hypothetical protein